jgi:hypothetical protein
VSDLGIDKQMNLPDGSLTRVGDPISTFNQPDGIKVTADGSFLAVVLPNDHVDLIARR